MHNAKGDRAHAKADGTFEIVSRLRVKLKVKDVTVEATQDRIVGRLRAGADAPRFVIANDHAKLRFGEHWIAVTDAGIVCSVAPVVGPDPEPEI